MKENKSIYKNPNFWIGLGTAGFVLMTWLGIYGAMTLPPAQIAGPSPSPSIKPVECVSSAGNIWSGVVLYTDSACTKRAGAIAGAAPGAQSIYILFDTGTSEWATRDTTKRFYIKSNDSAIAQMNLLLINP